MKISRVILILIAAALISVSSTIYYYSNYIVYETRTIPMDVKVSDHMGFNLDTDMLHFGISTSPGSASRKITVLNTYKADIRVAIKKSGTMAEWVTPGKHSFSLEPDEKQEIEFMLDVPPGVPAGNYTGEVILYFKRNR